MVFSDQGISRSGLGQEQTDLLLEVMSAQPRATVGIPNGTGIRDDQVQLGGSGTTGQPQMSSDVNPRDSQQRDQGVAPEDVANTATRQRATPEAPLGTETTAVAVQAGLTQESQTTLDAGRRSDLENVITGAEAAENVTGFVTPKSASGTRTHAPPAWLGNVEIPRWVSRLGAFLNQGGVVAQADLAPSPFPGSMHSLSPPPGGQVFRLRSLRGPMRYHLHHRLLRRQACLRKQYNRKFKGSFRASWDNLKTTVHIMQDWRRSL